MKINNETIAAQVREIRAFEREKIAPLMSKLPLIFRPKSAAGLVKVGAVGLYCKPCDVVAYRRASREMVNSRWEFKRSRLPGMFAAALIDNALDEAAALEACALNFHDDRPDGLLHVPAFRAKATRDAWNAAAAALGIVTRCRACVC